MSDISLSAGIPQWDWSHCCDLAVACGVRWLVHSLRAECPAEWRCKCKCKWTTPTLLPSPYSRGGAAGAAAGCSTTPARRPRVVHVAEAARTIVLFQRFSKGVGGGRCCSCRVGAAPMGYTTDFTPIPSGFGRVSSSSSFLAGASYRESNKSVVDHGGTVLLRPPSSCSSP
jgi:hypothetical protein